MFRLVEFWRTVRIPPIHVNPELDAHTDKTLKESIEGRTIAPYGYIACVLRIVNREKGYVQEGSGDVLIPVLIQALVLSVELNDVIDGVVSALNPLGFFITCGPLKAFIPKTNLDLDYKFEGDMWRSETNVITTNSVVRIRILGVKNKEYGIAAIGLINQDYLGVIAQ